MKNILEDLFFGNINVMDSLPVRKRKPVSGENAFIESLSLEQQDIYLKITDSILEKCGEQIKDSFMLGFKMALRMILESIADTPEKVQSEE